MSTGDYLTQTICCHFAYPPKRSATISHTHPNDLLPLRIPTQTICCHFAYPPKRYAATSHTHPNNQLPLRIPVKSDHSLRDILHDVTTRRISWSTCPSWRAISSMACP